MTKIKHHVVKRVVAAVLALAAVLLVGGGCDGAPETSIDSTPENPSNSGSASFGFSSDKENSTFQCNLDGAGFTTCTSPKEYSNLINGSHTFAVRAKADGQSDDSPANYTWTVQSEPEQATFEIQFLGFKVNNETFDNQFEGDGKGDEVYVRYDIHWADKEGTLLQSAYADQTATMGDTNGFPARVQAGSRSDKGGLKTEDAFPSSTPWEINTPAHDTYPRMVLFRGNLVDGETGVAITPTIWEWDGNKDILQVWGDTMSENGPKIAKALVPFITGTPDVNNIYGNAFEMGIPAAWDLIGDVFGRAQDRPIGGDPRNVDPNTKKMEFNAQTLVLTYDIANLAQQHDFGKGVGVLAMRYDDPASQTGSYTLYFRVIRLPCPPDCPT
jgi:hypothetical protein